MVLDGRIDERMRYRLTDGGEILLILPYLIYNNVVTINLVVKVNYQFFSLDN